MATTTTQQPQMQYQFLGKTGLKVSEYALGPFSSSMAKGNDDQSLKIVDTYVAAGGNFIDLSDRYTGAEKLFGQYLQKNGNREDLVIASKAGLPRNPTNANGRGLSRKLINTALTQTLQDLGTDYVDLYYCHWWDPGTSVEEYLRTMNDLIRSGKVHYIAASNIPSWQLQKVVTYAQCMGLEGFVALQTQYNLLDREVEVDLWSVCDNENVAKISWGPLAAGWLSGKYTRDNVDSIGSDPNTRVAIEKTMGFSINQAEARVNERTWRVIDKLNDVGKQVGRPASQVALRWVSDKGVLPILGPRTMDQLNDSLATLNWHLTPEQVKELDAAGQPESDTLGKFASFLAQGRITDRPGFAGWNQRYPSK